MNIIKGSSLLFLIIVLLSSFHNAEKETEESLTVNFGDLKVTIKKCFVYQENQDKNKIYKEEVNLYPELGESFDQATIDCKSSKYDRIEVFQSYETSLSINAEGPHCDLENWKHYTSKWTKVKPSKGVYQMINYPYVEGAKEKFPKVSMEEVRKAVSKHCDENWAKLIKNTKSIYEFPCLVTKSKITIKIVAYRGNEKSVKKINFWVPMGC